MWLRKNVVHTYENGKARIVGAYCIRPVRHRPNHTAQTPQTISIALQNSRNSGVCNTPLQMVQFVGCSCIVCITNATPKPCYKIREHTHDFIPSREQKRKNRQSGVRFLRKFRQLAVLFFGQNSSPHVPSWFRAGCKRNNFCVSCYKRALL